MGDRTNRPPEHGFARFWREFFTEPLARFDREARAFADSPAGRKADWQCMIAFIVVAFVLSIHHFLGGIGLCRAFAWWLDELNLHSAAEFVAPFHRDPEISKLDFTDNGRTEFQLRGMALTWWTYYTIGDVLLYFLLPVLVIKFGFRQRLSDYGVKLSGAFQDWWLYLVAFAVVGPLIYFVSDAASFQATYPYYVPSPGERFWTEFWLWEVQYLLSFFFLEFLFRGFLVHATRRRLGVYSIFAMTVPYCMIHFQKPLLECLGSILAGIGLGYMSLKTRSIWMGTSLHVLVAFSMDMASLWRQGYLG